MIFQNLQEVPIQHIADTFNLAFSDYVVPMHFTEAQLKEKLLRDGINLEHSVGAFAEGKLVGYILQGIGTWEGKNTAYNGGTGVVPAYRGRKLTQQLYEYSFPRLQEVGVEQCLLEVLQTNQPAVKTYRALGFKPTRKLISYKGTFSRTLPAEKENNPAIRIQKVSSIDWPKLKNFWDYSPSWQYSIDALQRVRHVTKLYEVTANNNLIGYGAVNQNTNRIAQFAIAPAFRRKGLGIQLFRELIAGLTGPVVIMNVAEDNLATNQFLVAGGLHPYITQIEMVLGLK